MLAVLRCRLNDDLSVCLYFIKMVSLLLGKAFNIALSFCEMGRMRGLLPFSGVMFSVLCSSL
jgi:hypothetical protein